MKKNILLTILLLSAMFAMAQSITVKFTAEDQNGNYFQLDAVKVTSISQNWNQTLAYPDTILILNYIDGIAELPVAEGLLQNKPNPFRGTTEATLTLQEEGQTKIQVIDMAGKVLAECAKTLTQGEHIIKVSLAEPQMALLRVSTPNHDYAVKMLNIAHGGANSIDVSTVTMKEVAQTKAVGAGPFTLGDVLSYTGVKMQGADMVLSNNTVTHAQYSDEVVTFVFDVETPQEPQLPIVVTSEVSDITLTTAVCGGEVISDGGAEVTTRGVCWATTANPTTSDSHTTDGSGLGEFVSDLLNLTAGSTYYLRAYAINSVGTAYGESKTFTTVSISLPEVITADVSDITSTTAVCGGEVISDGGAEVTARGVCWATTANPTTSDSHTTDGGDLGEFVSNLTNLTTGTSYYVRAYATNSVGTAYGELKSFITTSSLPMVITAEVSDISYTTAVCGGTVSDEGGSMVLARGVCWSENENPTILDFKTVDGYNIGDFTSTLSGLVSGTFYHVRAYATNSIGTSYGEEKVFKAKEEELPFVVTAEVSEITDYTAKCGGNVSVTGTITVTARGVCWSEMPDPTIENYKTYDGGGTGDFISSMTSLTPATLYYVRAYAEYNEGQVVYGDTKVFMSNPTLPQVNTLEITNITEYTVTCGGDVTYDGGASVTARGVCWGKNHMPH